MDDAGLFHQLVKRRVFEICKVHYKHVIIGKNGVKVETHDHKLGGVRWINLDATVQADSCYTFYILPILGWSRFLVFSFIRLFSPQAQRWTQANNINSHTETWMKDISVAHEGSHHTCRANGFHLMFFSRAGVDVSVLWGRFFSVRVTPAGSPRNKFTRFFSCQPT